MKSIVTYPPLARLGNSLYQFAAACAYAVDNGLDFSPPSATTDDTWRALYFKDLINPLMDSPHLTRVDLQEPSYAYHPLQFRPEWAEDHLIIVGGYRQSYRYFWNARYYVFGKMGFPWKPMLGKWCAVHLRRGDAIKYPSKHLIQSKEWIEKQMAKFPDHHFRFFSDDMPWAKATFGHRSDCHFEFPRLMPVDDDRPEVQDLVDASCCTHLIGSSSTFAAWIYFLNRNPDKRAIFPKIWLKPGWENTTEETWKDVLPTEVERA